MDHSKHGKNAPPKIQQPMRPLQRAPQPNVWAAAAQPGHTDIEHEKTVKLQIRHIELEQAKIEAQLDLRRVKYGSTTAHHIVPSTVVLPKTSEGRPFLDLEFCENFVDQVLPVLLERSRDPVQDHGSHSALRLHQLLGLAKLPTPDEVMYLSGPEASQQLQTGQFFDGPIVTEGQQHLPPQTLDQFLDEHYADDYKVFTQDPSVRLARNKPSVRSVSMKDVKKRFAEPADDKPWNLLELATHVEDGLRPDFLNTEDCRLLTKLKFPHEGSTASRHGYSPGWKEVEKWALVAQAGALTEPHQDSHGYSTYITVNQGLFGYGWLSHPTEDDRVEWRKAPQDWLGGNWRYVVLKPGQTVYFPAGTVHFVFRLPEAGNTLAFGGHVLRCSQIVNWIKTLLEEQKNKNITNEDLSVSAPEYLKLVVRFVKQAQQTGQEEKWGGAAAIKEFLKLKEKFDKQASSK